MTVADTDGRTTFYGYDPAGQLCSVADVAGERRFGYDAAGRLVTETHPEHGERRHSYDAAGQLRTIAGPGGEHHFGYDGAGRRGTEQHPDHSRRYDWDPLGRLTAVTTTATGCTRTTRLRVDALGQLAARRRHAPRVGQRRPHRRRCSPSATPRSSATATPGRRPVLAA